MLGNSQICKDAMTGNLTAVRYSTPMSTKSELADALYFAAKNGHVKVVKHLLKAKADVFVKDENFNTPMHLAAAKGHIKVVKILRDKVDSVDIKGQFDNTPLHSAAAKGQVKVVEYLIEEGADLHATNRQGYKPIYNAVSSGNLECVKYLESKGALVTIADEASATVSESVGTKSTLLQIAVLCRHVDIVKYFLNLGLDVNAEGIWGYTPIHCALTNDHLAVVKLLVENGADQKAVSSAPHKTPLYMAALYGSLPTMKYLVEECKLSVCDADRDVIQREINECIESRKSLLQDYETVYVYEELTDIEASITALAEKGKSLLYIAQKAGLDKEVNALTKEFGLILDSEDCDHVSSSTVPLTDDIAEEGTTGAGAGHSPDVDGDALPDMVPVAGDTVHVEEA